MMKVELKNCFLEEDHEHPIPYLETYEWEDGTSTQLPACCLNGDLGMDEFPTTIKRLIEINLTNELTQMVSGVYASVLMEIDTGMFFVSFYDVDEAPTDCYFIKGTIKQALEEYLIYNEQLDVPFMQIFKALQSGFLDKAVLSRNWIPLNIFNANSNWDGLKLRVQLQELHLGLKELISEATFDQSKVASWKREISALQHTKGEKL